MQDSTQPMLATFAKDSEVVYEHLADMLESAMQSAIEHEDPETLNQNETSRRLVLKGAMTDFLNFNMKTLDAQYINSDVEVFTTNVVNLFNEECITGLTLETSSIESSKPDTAQVNQKLKMLMVGYYFAIMKENHFNTSVEVDWKFSEIQKGMLKLMSEKLSFIMNNIQKMFHTEMQRRASEFTASFKVNHSHVVLILKSFKAYASGILIDQLRTFYFDIIDDPAVIDMSKPLEIFQRTVNMWMIAYKLCERDCDSQQFASLLPNFLEDMLLTRINNNDKIVENNVTKTFFSKFLGFLVQQNFEVNTPGENSPDLRNDNERYAMFIYRTFYSKGVLKSNQRLTNFMQMIHKKFGMNFLVPTPELKETDETEYNQRIQMTSQYLPDLVLYLDFPEFDESAEQSVDQSRHQPISFTDDEVLDLVKAAHVIFTFDLRTLNASKIMLHWFADYEDQNANEDYIVMYETIMRFRANYNGDTPGVDLDQFLDHYLVDPVVEMDEQNEIRVARLAQYWLMKSINMVNVLSGEEYDLIFSNAYPKPVQEDIIVLFRRIVDREEFLFMKKIMLKIFAYYREDHKVYSTDLEDDKFLNEVFLMSIECEKLPEILGTEVNVTTITLKDKEGTMNTNKKVLDDGSEKSVEIIVSSSEDSSSVFTDEKESPINNPIHNKSSPHVSNKLSHESSSHNVVIIEDESNSSLTQERSVNKSEKTKSSKLPIVIPVVVNNDKSSHDSHSSTNINILPVVNPSNNTKSYDWSARSDSKKIDNSQSSHVEEIVIDSSSNSSHDIDEDVHSPLNHNISSNSSLEHVSPKDDIPSHHTKSNLTNDVEEDTPSNNSMNRKKNKSQGSHQVDSYVTPQEIIETSSNNTNSNEKSVTSHKNDSQKSHVTSPKNKDILSEDSSLHTESHHTPVIVVNTSEKSSLDHESHDNSPNNIIETSSNSSVHSQSYHTTKDVIVTSENSSPKNESVHTPNEVIEISENSSVHNQSNHTTSNKSKVEVIIDDSSENSNNSHHENSKISSIYSEIDQDVIDVNDKSNKTSSKTSHNNSEPSHIIPDKSENTRQDELGRQNKKHGSTSTSVNVSMTSSNETSVRSSEKSVHEHPLTPDHVSTNSESHHTENITEDIDIKRHNLVYEVEGRLTPSQRKTFEFSDDVFASIKDLKIQTDEYGNETEYVYVQIVRKNSDCYQELLNFV